MDGKLMHLCYQCAENLSQIRKVTLRKYLFGKKRPCDEYEVQEEE